MSKEKTLGENLIAGMEEVLANINGEKKLEAYSKECVLCDPRLVSRYKTVSKVTINCDSCGKYAISFEAIKAIEKGLDILSEEPEALKKLAKLDRMIEWADIDNVFNYAFDNILLKQIFE